MHPSDEAQQIQATFARFVDERVIPAAQKLDEERSFPYALFAELGALGFFGLRYPEEVGGVGLDTMALCLAVEEIARGSMSLAGCATMQSLMGTKFLHLLGTPDIHERLLVPALRGEKIGAICMTEPDAGSDLGAIATTARRVDGGYVLNGRKTWVTSAPQADFFTVFARSGKERLLTIFLVERHDPGLTVGKAIPKMGMWALPTSELSLDECFVPETRRLSREEGDGESHLRPLLAEIRIVTAALAVGCGRAALEAAIRYAAERRQFGKPLNRFPGVQTRIAEMATRLEAARALLHRAAWLKDKGLPHRKEAAMAKVCASEAGVSACDSAARIFASYGYSMEFPIQRYLRDVRFTLIGGGTNEILHLVIAKELSA